MKSDLPQKARAQKSNLYKVTASFVFQACGSFICMVFSQCNASWLKQTNFEWVGEHWKTPVAMLCISQTKRSWKFWLRRGSDWSPIEVLALCPCVSFGLRWQGQELCPSLVADQPQKVFVETSIANVFFSFSFMTWIFFRIAILAYLSHIRKHEILFPKLLESKALHFRDSDFAHLRGWENLFPSLPSRKSTSEGAGCLAVLTFCHTRVFLFLPSLWI